MEPEALVSSKEECLRNPEVAPGYRERAAACDAKLVLLERSYLGKKRVSGVEIRVAEELPKGGVILSRSRLGDHIDDATQGAAIRRLVVVGLDLEFLDRIENRPNSIGTSKRTLIVQPVEQVEIAAVRLAVDRGIGKGADRIGPDAAAGGGVLRDVHGADARRQGKQLSEVAPVQGQGVDLVFDDGYAQLRGRSLQSYCFCRHGDTFRDGTGSQGDVERCRLVHDQSDVGFHGGLETGLADFQIIIPGLNVGNDVDASAICRRGSIQVGSLTVQYDGRIGDN